MNMNFKTLTKYALFIGLAFLFSNYQVYCETKSDDSFDLDSAIKHNYKIYSERKDNNYYALLNQMQTWTFSGNITNKTDANNITVKTKDREVSVRFLESNATYYKKGDYVSIKSIPYRENANKVISAIGMSIAKTNGEVNVISKAQENQNLGSSSNVNISRGSVGIQSQTPILLRKNCVISGKVTRFINSNRILIKYGDRNIMLILRNKEGEKFKVGDVVTVSCLPYREDRSGIVLARVNSIKKQ